MRNNEFPNFSRQFYPFFRAYFSQIFSLDLLYFFHAIPLFFAAFSILIFPYPFSTQLHFFSAPFYRIPLHAVAHTRLPPIIHVLYANFNTLNSRISLPCRQLHTERKQRKNGPDLFISPFGKFTVLPGVTAFLTRWSHSIPLKMLYSYLVEREWLCVM
jgi:hypothetical protein